MNNEPMRPSQPGPIAPEPIAPEPIAPPTTQSSPIAPPTPQPSPIAPPTPRSSPTGPAKRKNSGALVNIALAVAVAVAIGGVAFAVGRSTAPASAAGQTGRFGGGFGNGGQFPTGSGAPDFGGQGGFGRGGRTITGTVESVTAETLTIKTASGQTVELALGSDTTYSTKAAATASDVTTGATVEVQLDFGAGGGLGNGQGNSAPAASGPVGTAGNVTVVP